MSILNQQLYELWPQADFTEAALVTIHRALLALCAARADLFAVLVLPQHYQEDDALRHAGVLKRTIGLTTNALSYAALYHPWLISSEVERAGTLTRIPPDGAICGVMAQRALSRGAWVAPANETLVDVIALTPAIPPDSAVQLLDEQLNLIRQEPRGFLVLSADTLSGDEDLRPINVRRLLILLRRLALRLGPTYVFEPNNDAFRRMVQRGFEAMLGQMYERGAFAGRVPSEAFQVVVSDTLNTPQSVDQGRFTIELRVAPSLPLTFLTVRLVQTNDRLVVAEGR